MADWSLLPRVLVEKISGHLKTSIDLLRFRSVCSSWRSAVPPNHGAPSSTSLLIPSDGIHPATLAELSIRTVFLISPLDSATPRSWLVKGKSADEFSTGRKHLLCPLSPYRFNPLPSGLPRPLELFNFRIFELGNEYAVGDYPIRTYPRPPFDDFFYIRKVVVTWLDRGPHFLLLGIIDEGYLALYKSVDRRWSAIRERSYPYSDVIAYNENHYAVDKSGRTVRVGLNGQLELIANANPLLDGLVKNLVESTRGKLLLVDLYVRTDYGDEALLESPTLVLDDWIKEFWNYTAYQSARVYELDEESQSWIAVSCLDDQVLFLGKDSSFSASASDLSGCSGNCIFFLDSFGNDENTKEESGVYLGKNISVLELGTGTTGRLSSYPEYAEMFWPPPERFSSASLEKPTHNHSEGSSLIHDDPAL